jgi:hypothetical protein
MAKLTKDIENRLSVSRKVVAAATTHGPELAPVLAASALEAQGVGNGPDAAAFEATFASLAALLSFTSSALEKAALEHAAEQADDIAPRIARDAARDAASVVMVQLRSAVESAMGQAGLRTYGLEGETPRMPKALASHIGNVIHLLQKNPIEVTSELGSVFSSAVIVPALEKRKKAIDDALLDVDREERELESTQGKRDRALTRWVDVYQGTANTLVGLFRLAGRKDLAERVRPTSRTISGEDAGSAEEGAQSGSGQGAQPSIGQTAGQSIGQSTGQSVSQSGGQAVSAS